MATENNVKEEFSVERTHLERWSEDIDQATRLLRQILHAHQYHDGVDIEPLICGADALLGRAQRLMEAYLTPDDVITPGSDRRFGVKQ